MKHLIGLLAAFAFALFCSEKGAAQQKMQQPVIQFSGYTWYIRNNVTSQGPGPNYFSSQNVWVDDKGWLHLLASPDSTGKWQCAEIYSKESFLYGTYTWQVQEAIDKMDKNVVLGLFNYSGNDGYDEMDIEFARWGNSSYPNLNYTIWPADTAYKNYSYTKEFVLSNTYSTHLFRRDRNSVTLQSFNGFHPARVDLIAETVCKQPPYSVSSLAMPVHINLWLFDGNPPAGKQPVEIIIRSFTFKP